MTARPILSDSRRRPVRAAVALCIVIVAVLLVVTVMFPLVNANDNTSIFNNHTVSAGYTEQQIPAPLSNQTLTPDESGKAKLAAIAPIQNYKANMTYWQKKIDSSLLQIVDPANPGFGMNISQKYLMQKLMQLIPAENVTTELNVPSDSNKKIGDHVVVYIILNQVASPETVALISPYTTEIVDTSKQTIIAWVDLANIIDLAKRDVVTNIRLVDRGVTLYAVKPDTTNNSVNNGIVSLQQTRSNVSDNSVLSAKFSPTTPSSPLSILGIVSALLISGLIIMRIKK